MALVGDAKRCGCEHEKTGENDKGLCFTDSQLLPGPIDRRADEVYKPLIQAAKAKGGWNCNTRYLKTNIYLIAEKLNFELPT